MYDSVSKPYETAESPS